MQKENKERKKQQQTESELHLINVTEEWGDGEGDAFCAICEMKVEGLKNGAGLCRVLVDHLE